MYKMKEVCQMTGLTEKAIRIYMEQKLVEPEVEEGIHRKSYFFKEKDVERLKDVSALRNAGFSMAEIKQMLESPEKISLLVEEKKALFYFIMGVVLLGIFGICAVELFGKKDDILQGVSVSESQKLEYPVNAEGVAAIHFYQGEEEIEKYIADDFSYILTSDYMLYPVMPIQMEFRGADLGDTDYITGFLSRFGAKVRERYAVEEILESISDAGHLEDLKKLLEIQSILKVLMISMKVISLFFRKPVTQIILADCYVFFHI